MKNSTIPYGYSMQNGQTVVVAAEKDVVKRIYLGYLPDHRRTESPRP